MGNIEENICSQEQNEALAAGDAIVREGLAVPSVEDMEREKRLELLESCRITTQTAVPDEQYALSVGGVGIFALRDIHAIKAKQKHGKTSALKICTGALMAGELFSVKSELSEPSVLYLDTEQKRSDAKLVLTDVMRMTEVEAAYIDEHIHLYSLRKQSGDLMADDIELLIGRYRPQVVIVDGIVEFVASFNDETESKRLVSKLQVMSEQHDCAIVCVLHTNKSDEDHNMRGHLGTMLAQKAGTVLECKKDRGIFTVRCTDSRHEEMPDWSFRYGPDGMLMDADRERQELKEQHEEEKALRRQEMKARTKKERTDYTLKCISDKGGSISRKQLTEILVKHFELSRPTVSSFISSLIEEKTLYDVDGLIQTSNELSINY